MTPGPADGGNGGEPQRRRGSPPPRSLRERGRVERVITAMPSRVALPRQNGELVFEDPWESRAFGMAVALHQAGVFEWEEFQRRLVDEIAAWERDHDDDDRLEGWSYYERWTRSFEGLLVDKGVCSPSELAASSAAVRAAADHDGHGDHDGDHHH